MSFIKLSFFVKFASILEVSFMNAKQNLAQRVMVYCDFSASDYWAIAHGMRISEIFQLELCLFHSVEGKTSDAKTNAQIRLASIIKQVQCDCPTVSIASLCLKGCFEDTIRRVADGFDAVLMVCSTAGLNLKMKALQQSRIPFLFVGEKAAKPISYQQVILPLDYRKAMQSGLLWGTYFARFNHSDMELLTANEREQSNQAKLQMNIESLERVMRSFGLKAKYTKGRKSSFGLPREALLRAKAQQSDLLIIAASQKLTLIDWWLGLPEAKLIKQAEGLPVLCINPSQDMIALCD